MKTSSKLGSTQAVLEPTQPFRNKLMLAASAGILAFVAPGGLYGARANAQQVNVLPPQCSDAVGSSDLDNNGNGDIDSGETITCVQDLTNPGDIDPIASNVDELTLIIGDGATPTRVYNDYYPMGVDDLFGTTAIEMDGDSDQSLVIKENGIVGSENSYLGSPAIKMTSSSGSISLTNQGIIATDAPGGFGNRDVALDARVSGGAGDINILSETGKVYGVIYAKNEGTGQINITTGLVELLTSVSTPTGPAITVRTGNTTGDVSLRTTDQVTAYIGLQFGYLFSTLELTAIDIQNLGVGKTELTIEGDVSASRAIKVDHSADGALNITTASGTTVTSANGNGIFATNTGSAASYIKTDGAVSGAGIYSRGVGLTHSGGGTATINANSTVTGEQGIYLKNQSTSAATINLGRDGVITGTAEEGIYIEAQRTASLTTIRGDLNQASGERYGRILGQTHGIQFATTSSEILIEDLAQVYGETESGISTKTEGGKVTIQNVTSVTSKDKAAIDVDTSFQSFVSNQGFVTGGADISIQNVGIPKISDGGNPNTRSIYSADGIVAISGTGNINIGAALNQADSGIGDIYSSNYGIRAESNGGSIDIRTVGTIRAGSTGVSTRTYDATTTLVVDGNIETIQEGISARTAGKGDVDITINGDVTVGFDDAPEEFEVGVVLSASDLTGTAANPNALSLELGTGASVRGGFVCVGSLQSGGSSGANPAGDIIITGDGTSTIEGKLLGLAISGGGLDVDISGVGAIIGASLDFGTELQIGMDVASEGGAISIRNIGSVTARYGTAIVAETRVSATSEGFSRDGADISIQNVAIPRIADNTDPDTPYVYSGIGIVANSGTGSINIGAKDNEAANAIGDIFTLGTGIEANSEGAAVQILVDGTIDAGEAAIEVESKGAGAITEVTLGGRVTSDSATLASVVLNTTAGATVNITETGSVASTNGNAIEFAGYEGTVTNDTLTLSGSVLSDVMMGTGDDTFNLSGTMGDGSTVFGGDWTDTVSITSVLDKTLTNSGGSTDAIQEFEILYFDGDNAVLAGEHVGWQQANFRQGTTSIAESAILRATTATIFAGATLNARDGSSFEGNLINNGRLEIGSSPGRFNLIGNFTQGANGVLPIEYDGATGTGDFLFVSGEATLDGTLELRLLTPPTETTSFEFLQALGGISGEFSLLDSVPDVDFGVTFSDSRTIAELGPIAVSVDPDPDPDPDMGDTGGGSDTGGSDDGSGDGGDSSDGGGAGDGSDPTDPVAPVEPDPDPEPAAPLLSPKELVPSALMAGMFASDLFADSLIQRRSETMTSGEWSFWTTGLGGRYDVGNSAGQTGWEGGNSGFAFGAQHLFEQNGAEILFGLSTGFTEADLDSSISHGKVDSVHLGGFVNAQIDGLFLAAAASHAWQDYDLQRVFVMGDGRPVATRAETEGKASTFKTRLHYDLLWAGIGADGLSLGPVLTADLTTASFNRFKESGAGLLNLIYEEETAQQVVVGAGAQGRYMTTVFNQPRIETGFHLLLENLSGDSQITSRASLAVPGADFTPSSAKLDNTRAALGADAKFYFSDKIYGHIRYDTTRSDSFTDHEGWAGVTFRF